MRWVGRGPGSMDLDEVLMSANDGMVLWLGYRAIPRGAWQPTGRDEVPDWSLFPTKEALER
eukprot:8874419-Lingulodinium_polyedra.AAC.1